MTIPAEYFADAPTGSGPSTAPTETVTPPTPPVTAGQPPRQPRPIGTLSHPDLSTVSPLEWAGGQRLSQLSLPGISVGTVVAPTTTSNWEQQRDALNVQIHERQRRINTLEEQIANSGWIDYFGGVTAIYEKELADLRTRQAFAKDQLGAYGREFTDWGYDGYGWGSGFKTSLKAGVNATADLGAQTISLGFWDPGNVFEPTEHDLGYDASRGFWDVGLAAATAAGTLKLGTALRGTGMSGDTLTRAYYAGVGLEAFDVAGSAAGAARNGYSIYNDGLTWSNGFGLVADGIGLTPALRSEFRDGLKNLNGGFGRPRVIEGPSYRHGDYDNHGGEFTNDHRWRPDAPSARHPRPNLAARTPEHITISQRNLRKIFDKAGHGSAFGLSGKWRKGASIEVDSMLRKFISSRTTHAIKGTYRGEEVIRILEPASRRNVIFSPDGTLIGAWGLSPEQLGSVLELGRIF